MKMKTAKDITVALIWISAMSAAARGKELRTKQNRMETIIRNLFGARCTSNGPLGAPKGHAERQIRDLLNL
jgi:hypothetical protein